MPVAELAPQQIVQLNRTSTSVQLPLGVGGSALVARTATGEGGLTQKLGSAGQRVTEYLAARLMTSPAKVAIWSGFVILPALVLLLLVALVSTTRKSRKVTKL